MKGIKRNKKGQFIKGFGFWTGKKRPGLKTKSQFKKGNISWNTGTGKPYVRKRQPKPDNVQIICSCGCGKQFWKYDLRFRKRLFISGHNFWRGGVTSENKILRGSARYRRWRTAIFERDNYTCQGCSKRGGRLNADHIKPWALYINLRFDIKNGRTLCVECHQKTDTYGIEFSRKLRGGGLYAYQ